jgi:hypothetical protein
MRVTESMLEIISNEIIKEFKKQACSLFLFHHGNYKVEVLGAKLENFTFSIVAFIYYNEDCYCDCEDLQIFKVEDIEEEIDQKGTVERMVDLIVKKKLEKL